MADDQQTTEGYYDSNGTYVSSTKGRAAGNTKDFQDTRGLAAAAEANRKKKAAAAGASPAPGASPSPSPDPSTMSPLARAAYENQKKREAQAKGVEK